MSSKMIALAPKPSKGRWVDDEATHFILCHTHRFQTRLRHQDGSHVIQSNKKAVRTYFCWRMRIWERTDVSTVYSVPADSNRMHHSKTMCFGDLSMLHGYSILSFLVQSRFDPLETYCSTALNSVPTYLSGCGLLNGYLTNIPSGY